MEIQLKNGNQQIMSPLCPLVALLSILNANPHGVSKMIADVRLGDME